MISIIFLIINGMLFGIANLIPGVSGGTIAVITGCYERLLDSINNLFKKFKESISFLGIFILGALIAVLIFSKILSYSTDNFKIPTYCLFVGLILGGIPAIVKPVYKKCSIKNIIFLILGFSLVIGLLFIPSGNTSSNLEIKDYIMLFICGILASIAMVVPGISGMMMLEIFGYRELFIDSLKNLTDFSLFLDNFKVLCPVGIGIIIGLFSAAKLMGFLLKRYNVTTFYAIIGFVLASIVVLFINMSDGDKYISHIIVGIIMIPIGFTLSFMLDYLSKKYNKEKIIQNDLIEDTPIINNGDNND